MSLGQGETLSQLIGENCWANLTNIAEHPDSRFMQDQHKSVAATIQAAIEGLLFQPRFLETLVVSGVVALESGATHAFASVTVLDGGLLTVKSGGVLRLRIAGLLDIRAGGTIDLSGLGGGGVDSVHRL